MSRSRDNQKHKVYEAEREWWKAEDWDRLELREIQRITNGWMRTDIFNAYSRSREPFRVRLGMTNTNHSWVDYYGTEIVIANSQRILPVLLHEFPHMIDVRARGNSHGHAWHGPEYMWMYRSLVEEVMTKAQFLTWESIMLKHDVRWNREAAELRMI